MSLATTGRKAVHLNMKTIYNGVLGDVEAGPEMHFFIS